MDFVLGYSKLLLQSRQGIPFILFAKTLNNKGYILDTTFNSIQEKQTQFKYLAIAMAYLRAKEYYALSQGWTLPANQREEGKEIRLHFQKKEALLLVYINKNYQAICQAQFKRFDGVYVFNEADFREQDGFETGLANFINFKIYKDDSIYDKLMGELKFSKEETQDPFFGFLKREHNINIVEMNKKMIKDFF